MSKILLQIQATAVIELDGGYYRNDNMTKIEELLRESMQTMHVHISQGSSEPELCENAKLKLKGIVYLPND